MAEAPRTEHPQGADHAAGGDHGAVAPKDQEPLAAAVDAAQHLAERGHRDATEHGQHEREGGGGADVAAAGEVVEHPHREHLGAGPPRVGR
jgi:hypothetical protein